MLIAAYALQVRNALRLHPRRIRPALPPSRRRGGGGVRGGLLRRRNPRHRFRLRHRGLSRRRLLRLRRGLGAAHLDRGQARLSAQPAAAPDRAGPVPAARPSSTTSRRCPTSPGSSPMAAPRSRRSASPRIPGTRLVSISGHIARPGRLRGRDGLSASPSSSTRIAAACSDGGALKGVIPGGISTKVLTAAGDRAAHPRQSGRCRRRAPRWAPAA